MDYGQLSIWTIWTIKYMSMNYGLLRMDKHFWNIIDPFLRPFIEGYGAPGCLFELNVIVLQVVDLNEDKEINYHI